MFLSLQPSEIYISTYIYIKSCISNEEMRAPQRRAVASLTVAWFLSSTLWPGGDIKAPLTSPELALP